MTARTETLLWVAQRASAAVLALAVVIHLATVVYAVRAGLTAAEIIARLQGNMGWFLFYLVFIVAAAVHAPLGVRIILAETTRLRGPILEALTVLFGAALAVLGWRAAYALFSYGAG